MEPFPVLTSLNSNQTSICRTNLPKEVMGFPDFPFKPTSYNGKSFIFHEEVLDYLRKYASEFDLERFISVSMLCLRVCSVQGLIYCPCDASNGIQRL